LGAIRAVPRAGEPCEILFFLSGKQRAILMISRRPNVTKFENDTASICEAMNPFEIEFLKFSRKGLFKKTQKSIISTSFGLQTAITPQ